ncbi:hypothetical protein [Roseimarinus sediminis]|jgi:hypothetical protein|uniref:hypothetical protein n=1 Tax=Roseimarinus sediminis TaxID=1610899 RepID=UPI003D1AD2AF
MNQTIFTPTDWNKLCRLGGIMALIVVAIIPVQIVIFGLWPPPSNVLDFFKLFQQNWFLGLLSLDLLYLVNNILLAFVYLALFAALRKTKAYPMFIALVLGFIGIAVYYASTAAFEMFSLSKQYYATTDAMLQQQLLAAGQAIHEAYKGTAFVVYYILNGIALVIIGFSMLNDPAKTFSRTTAIWGLISAFLMTIPSTFGTIGLIFSIASLVPWIVFSKLIAKRLFQISKTNEQ